MNALARILLRAPSSLCVLALPTLASAQVVYVIDDDGGAGVSFTDIQPAVDVAGSLDRIDVRDGTYGSVSIDRPVTIMGLTVDAASVRVGRVTIDPIAIQETVVLSKMRLTSVESTGALGTVLLDRIVAGELVLQGCADCRLQNSSVMAPDAVPLSSPPAVWITDSFLQVSASQVRGARGRDGFLFGGVGGPAFRVQGQCSLVVARSDVRGGQGGEADFGLSNQRFGERGGDGIEMAGATAQVLLLDSALSGGPPGDGTAGNDGPGAPLVGCSPATVISLCRTTTSGAPLSTACLAATTTDNALPSIVLLDGNTPGQAGAIEFRGRAGAFARVLQGRDFAFAPSPFGVLPRLVSVDRTSSVGPFAAGAPTTWNYVTSPFRRGSRFHFQIAQPRPTFGLDWSNAMTILID